MEIQMSLITISRGSFSKGAEVAEKVATKLGYECIARRVLIEASEQFNIPEIKLLKALHDSPSIFNRFTYGKERYIAYIRYAFLKYLQKDNIVYHGLAGHFFLKDLSHVLKVRVIADMELRIEEELKRENLTEKEARQRIIKDDEERRKWGQYLYQIDTWDPSLYDLVIHIGRMTVEDAVDVIVNTVLKENFQTTDQSRKRFDDLLLSAYIKSILIDQFPTIQTEVSGGKVNICCMGALGQQDELTKEISSILEGKVDLGSTEIQIAPILTPD
jgi:cytidylate kinase